MLTKPEILVIDNDQNILDAFNNFLMRHKIKMTGTTSIDNGLKILRKRKIDLIIFDARPDMISLSSFLQNTKQIIPGIPQIAITGYPDKINKDLLKNFGIEYLFVKPPDLGKLQNAIFNCLHLNLSGKFNNQ